jgi:hypothetical protein
VHMAVSRMRHGTMIDINSGTFDQLKTLVGIGDTYAKRIVECQPYQCTDEPETKKIIPQTTLRQGQGSHSNVAEIMQPTANQEAMNPTVARTHVSGKEA